MCIEHNAKTIRSKFIKKTFKRGKEENKKSNEYKNNILDRRM